jgi:hypothetical protein
MNPQKDNLSEALRELAATSPQASPELGVRLSNEFTRHHVQRRRKRTAVAIGLAVCIAICAYWPRPRGHAGTAKVVTPAAQTAQAPTPAPQVAAPEPPNVPAPSVASSGARPKVRAKEVSKSPGRSVNTPAATVEAGDFVALPSFDPAIPVGESQMVRMDLPGSDLQLMGYPIEGQLLDRRILTDVLVGQDGMPYAVRLVQARNVR